MQTATCTPHHMRSYRLPLPPPSKASASAEQAKGFSAFMSVTQQAGCARVGRVQAAEQAPVVLLSLARLGQPGLLRAAVLLQRGLRRRRALHQAVVVRPAHGPSIWLVHVMSHGRRFHAWLMPTPTSSCVH